MDSSFSLSIWKFLGLLKPAFYCLRSSFFYSKLLGLGNDPFQMVATYTFFLLIFI